MKGSFKKGFVPKGKDDVKKVDEEPEKISNSLVPIISRDKMDNYATKFLKEFCPEALEYGICLYLGEQVLVDKDKAQSYFEMAIQSDDFGVLVELVSFLDYVDPFRFDELIGLGKKRVQTKIEQKSKELGFDASKLN